MLYKFPIQGKFSQANGKNPTRIATLFLGYVSK